MRADAEAYLSRLQQFATVLDNDTAEQRAQAARGFLAPGWSLDLALGQMRKLRDARREQTRWSNSVASRTAAKKIAGDWQRRAPRRSSPTRSIPRSTARSRRSSAAPDDPPRRRRLAPARRRRNLRRSAAPGDDHQLHPRRSPPDRARQVAEITRRARHDPQAARATPRAPSASGSQRSTSRSDPALSRHRCRPRRADRRPQRRRQGHVRRLPQAFATLPNAAARDPPRAARNPGRRVQRLLPPRRARRLAARDLLHQPQGHRRLAEIHAADPHLPRGRPGPSPADQPRPGVDDIPTLRKIGFFSAYTEGWALYAEQLADELGVYADDPLGRAGYPAVVPVPRRPAGGRHRHPLQALEPRAGDRLYGPTTGFARPRSQREVERYCAPTGQACSYKVGHTAWPAPAPKRRRRSAPKFDIKRFHEVLRDGAMPLTILERRIRERTARIGRYARARLSAPAPRPFRRLRASGARRPRFRARLRGDPFGQRRERSGSRE